MRIGRLWATVVAVVALALIGGGPAYAAGTVNIAVSGPGAVNWTVNDLESGTCPGACTVAVPNVRECEERICITFPGRIDLYAADSDKAYGFTRWDGDCQGTNRACSVTTPRTGTATYSVTASFGDNAPPSVALTAPGGGFVRGAVTVSADAADNFGVAKVDLALGGTTVAATGAPFAAAIDSAQLPDGPTNATARATDVNGLASAVASAPVTIDNTPPTLDVTGPSNRTYAPGSTQVWVLAGADATSGSPRCSAASRRRASRRASAPARQPDGRDLRQPAARRVSLHGPRRGRRRQRHGRQSRLHDRRHPRGRAGRQRRQAARKRRHRRAGRAARDGRLRLLRQAQRDALLRADAQAHPARCASVRVTCAKGCPRKTYKPKRLKSTLSLKPYLKRLLKPGAVLTVTISKPGAMTMVKRFTIRRSQRPRLESLCQAPGAKKAQRC